MTRSVYTLCGFEKNKPVGFCVFREFCGNYKQRSNKLKKHRSTALYNFVQIYILICAYSPYIICKSSKKGGLLENKYIILQTGNNKLI